MIKEAYYLQAYQLKVVFLDNTVKTINLQAFLTASTHPLIRKYLDLDLFKGFRIEYGTLCWGDNDFDLNPQNIYNGLYD